jgi:hypothetical protein
MPTKYAKLALNKSNGHERYQNFPFKGLPKCTKIGRAWSLILNKKNNCSL